MILPIAVPASGSVMFVVGIALVSKETRAMLWSGFVIGGLTMTWLFVWAALLGVAPALVASWSEHSHEWWKAAAINCALATISAVPSLIFSSIFLRLQVPIFSRLSLGFVWFLGVILPFIGVGNSWPVGSQILLGWLVFVSAILALAAGGID